METSILAQIARIRWIEAGDDNSTYFCASVKEKYCKCRNEVFLDDEGNYIKDHIEIGKHAINFYKLSL